MTRRRRLLIEEAKKYGKNPDMWVTYFKAREKACGKQLLRQKRLRRKKISPFTKDYLSKIIFNYQQEDKKKL